MEVLDALERLLQGDQLEPEAVAAWRTSFDQALACASRGPGWAEIAARARALAARLDTRTEALVEQRDRLRSELNLQGQGARALKGYRST